MGRFIKGAWLALLFVRLLYPQQQNKFEIWRHFKGFSTNVYELFLLKETFVVKAIQGKITFQDEDGPPMEEVLFEIRGPGNSETIRSVLTDDNGKFKIKNIGEGTYFFMVSKAGYTAYGGEITLSKHCKTDRKLNFHLNPSN